MLFECFDNSLNHEDYLADGQRYEEHQARGDMGEVGNDEKKLEDCDMPASDRLATAPPVADGKDAEGSAEAEAVKAHVEEEIV